jgi:hypothetical protein
MLIKTSRVHQITVLILPLIKLNLLLSYCHSTPRPGSVSLFDQEIKDENCNVIQGPPISSSLSVNETKICQNGSALSNMLVIYEAEGRHVTKCMLTN